MHTPIIGLMVHAFAHDQEEFLKAGMDTSLTRPVNEEGSMEAMPGFFS